jgi:acyl-CoA-binding protein
MHIPLDDTANGMDLATTSTKTFDEALKAINDTIFGTVNNESKLGDALNKLGGGLYKSGSFGNDEGGRANVKNMQDALKAAQDYYATLAKANQLTKDQANAGYGDFVNQLIGKVQANGGQLGGIADLARATVDQFKATIGTDAGGANAPKIAVTADATPALAQAAQIPKTAQGFIDAQNIPSIGVNANTTTAQTRVLQLAEDLAKITGYPYQVVLDALTKPGADKAVEIKALLKSIENHTYTAPVNANTSAAITNVQNFVNYARAALASLNGQTQSTSDTLARLRVPGFTAGATGAPASIALPATDAPAAPSQVAAPTMDSSDLTGANNGLLSALDNIGQGYDNAGDKAEKAGKKGTQAAQDQANGLDAAAQAADDYANRLKQGFDHAFQMQYGLSTATDAYYSQLNAINKARDDENQKVSDLRDKIRQLKDDQQTELVDANKAKIEQTISVKYGETARAEDYGSQAQKHLDTADAKQKEIDANQKEMTTTQAGIGQLDGYTDAAIKNRAALRDLEQKHLDMVVAYAKTGASVDQVRAYTKQLDAQFASDVSQLGYNQNAVNGLIGNLGRYIGVVNAVPYVKPTTLTVEDGAAMDKLGAFNGAADWATRPRDMVVNWRVNGGFRDVPGKLVDGQQVEQPVDQNGTPMGWPFYNSGGEVQGFADGGLIPGSAPSDPSADNMMASVDGKGYIKVRSREFIQPQEAVDYYGMQFMEDIRRMRLPKFSASSGPVMMSGGGGGGGGGMQVTSLSADSLAMLAKMSDRPIYLFTNDEVIARSAARGNTVLATKGVSD